MVTSAGTVRGAEGGNNGGAPQGRLVPGLTFETYYEERAFESS